MRKCNRPPLSVDSGSPDAFHAMTISRRETEAAQAKAKDWGVTLNDLCLAALLLSVAPLTTKRFTTSRSRLSCACVVNLRGKPCQPATGAFRAIARNILDHA